MLTKESSVDFLAVDVARRCYEVARQMTGYGDSLQESAIEGWVHSQSPDEVTRASRYLKEVVGDRSLFVPVEVTSKPDDSGDAQISYDKACHAAAEEIAHSRNALVFGEEDRFRALNEGQGPISRGEAFKQAIYQDKPVVLVDPIDGSHQCAGMYQPGGYGAAVMTVMPASASQFGDISVVVAIALGTGQLVYTNGHQVWLRNLTNFFEEETYYELDSQQLRARVHHATTWVLPGYKLTSMKEALLIAEKAKAHNDGLEPSIIAPLGGNPGILSSLILAPAGAVAAYQAKCWAWDVLVAYIVTALGWPVIKAATGEQLTGESLKTLLLQDVMGARKTDSLIMAKELAHANAMRQAVIEADVLR